MRLWFVVCVLSTCLVVRESCRGIRLTWCRDAFGLSERASGYEPESAKGGAVETLFVTDPRRCEHASSRSRDVADGRHPEMTLETRLTSTHHLENGSLTCIGRGVARGIDSWGKPRCRNTRSIDSGLKIIVRTRRRPPQGQRRISVRNTLWINSAQGINAACWRWSAILTPSTASSPISASTLSHLPGRHHGWCINPRSSGAS